MIKKQIFSICLIVIYVSFSSCEQQNSTNIQKDDFVGSIDKSIDEKIKFRMYHDNSQTGVFNHNTGQETPQLLLGVFGGLLCALILTISIIFAVFYVYKKNKTGSTRSSGTNSVTSTNRTVKRLKK